MTSGTWLVIALLVGLSALYVAAELSAVGVRRSQLRALADEGHVLAARLLDLLDDPRRLDRYISASQIGITLTNLILGAFTAARVTPYVEEALKAWVSPAAANAIVLLLLSVLLMVLGELVPKSAALHAPLRVALLTARPMQVSQALFRPLIGVLNGTAEAILRVLGFQSTGHRHVHSPEEIDLLLVESRDGGLLEPDEQERLHRVLQLAHLTARQIMVPRLYLDMVNLDLGDEQVLEHLLRSTHTRLPAYRETPDNVLGLLHSRDVVLHVAEHGTLTNPEQLLRDVPAVSEHVSADRLLMLLREHRTEVALVVDEYGGVAGMVSVQDILTEILDEIPDASLGGQPEPERLADGRVRLPGLMRLDEAEAWLGVLWSGEAETVGGRVTEELGRLPAPGAEVVIDGVRVRVERVARQAVMAVLALPVPDSEEAGDG